jgi:hypothetical protein
MFLNKKRDLLVLSSLFLALLIPLVSAGDSCSLLNLGSCLPQKLFNFYGDKTAKHIKLLIRIIFFGNLYGNTWDAVISRFKGSPAKNSHSLTENS